MHHSIFAPELRELIGAGNAEELRLFCHNAHPAMVAEMLSALSPHDAFAVLRNAEQPLRSHIFTHLDEDMQIELAVILSRNDIVSLLTDMPPDDRADLFKRMPEDRQEVILPGMAQAEREDIRRLTAHEEGTAGAAMTSDYATLRPEITAAQGIERLRREAPNKETIYYAYIVDDARKLLGYVSLKDLILAPPSRLIREIMHLDVIFARTSDDQEDAARKIQKFDLLALPVINGGDALVGIITHDDALDIITQEHTEDLEKFMAIAGSHEAGVYLKTPAWVHFKNRAGWIVGLAFLGLVSGFIVQNFEGLLMQFTILAAFMPMLADTGGNTGSQSATLVVRALALKEISPKDIFRILAREFQVALMLALLLGVIAFGRVMVFGGGSAMPASYSLVRISLAISLALGLQVVTSTLVGAILPLGAAKLKLDPAVVASPALTTIVDITGLLIYFTIARMFLGV